MFKIDGWLHFRNLSSITSIATFPFDSYIYIYIYHYLWVRMPNLFYVMLVGHDRAPDISTRSKPLWGRQIFGDQGGFQIGGLESLQLQLGVMVKMDKEWGWVRFREWRIEGFFWLGLVWHLLVCIGANWSIINIMFLVLAMISKSLDCIAWVET